jgi:hypothetical protein
LRRSQWPENHHHRKVRLVKQGQPLQSSKGHSATIGSTHGNEHGLNGASTLSITSGDCSEFFSQQCERGAEKQAACRRNQMRIASRNLIFWVLVQEKVAIMSTVRQVVNRRNPWDRLTQSPLKSRPQPIVVNYQTVGSADAAESREARCRIGFFGQ